MYDTYMETDGLVQDNILICPRKIRVERVWTAPNGNFFHKNLVGTGFLKIVKLNDAVLDRYREESNNLAREYIDILKSLR